MQRRVFRIGAGVTADQMQGADRHIKLVIGGIFKAEKFGHLAGDFQRLQAAITPDAMIFVHHRRADGEFGQIANDAVGIADAFLSSPSLHDAGAEQLRFGDDGKLGIAE